MSEYSPYGEEKTAVKKKKKAKIKPKAVFGVICGVFFIFIVSFLLSFMLMNHSLPMSGGNSLQEENEELKAKVERLEERLEKYEDVDDFADKDVPKEYTGATITPGGSEPASTNKSTESNNKTESEGSSSGNAHNEPSEVDEEESAFNGIITEEDVPANTGISDAPVELN